MKVILKPYEDEIVIKKSKFICNIAPVESEEMAKEFVQSISKTHYKATHNVPVYVIGKNYEVVKYSDDNEPSGTAGKPILNVLQNNQIMNVAVVVTRYFGGIKLGTGGLQRAYSGVVLDTIAKAELVELDNYVDVKFVVGYAQKELIEYELNQNQNLIFKINYTDSVEFDVSIKAISYQAFTEKMNSLLLGKYKETYNHQYYGYLKAK